MRAGCWSLWLGISYTGSWPDTKDVSFWSSFDLNQWLRNGKHNIFFQKFVSAIKILPYFLSKRKSSGADNGVLVLWSKKGWVYVIVHYQFTTPWKKPVVFQQCCAKPCSSFPNLKLSAFGGSQELLLPKCDQWCFAFVLAWEPQNQLLLSADLTGSCCFLQMATADPSHSLCCVRQSPLAQREYRRVRPCGCSIHGTLLKGCWWLLMEGSVTLKVATETSVCSEEKKKKKQSI